MRSLLGCAFGLLAIGGLSAAPVVYQETVSGDLSSNGHAPTIVGFDIGVNSISGTMGRTGSVVDSDIFAFTVEPGQMVTSIFLVSMNPAENSFFAIGAGPTIRTNVTHPAEDGSSHLSNLLIRGLTGEFLPQLAAGKEFGAGGSGITDPLGPGTYTIWFQETTTTVNYEWQITVVPEPGTLSLALVAGQGLLGSRRLSRRER